MKIHFAILALSTLIFLGMACKSSGNAQGNAQSKTIQLKVNHYMAPCMAESIIQCYVVRWNDQDWDFFSENIEGFNFEWGKVYQLEIEEITPEKSNRELVQEGSGVVYKLKGIESETVVSPDETFDLTLMESGIAAIQKKGEREWTLFGRTVALASLELSKKLETAIYEGGDFSGTFQHHNNFQQLLLTAINK